MARNNSGPTSEVGGVLMCELCDDRFAQANSNLDGMIKAHNDYRTDAPERTTASATSDLANVFLQDIPIPVETSEESVAQIRSLAILLAAAIERLRGL